MWLYRQDDTPVDDSDSDKSHTTYLQEHQPAVAAARAAYPKTVNFIEDYSEDEEPVERLRRYVGGELSLNVSLLHHMNTGLWYMAFYNDALTQTQVRTKKIFRLIFFFVCVCVGGGILFYETIIVMQIMYNSLLNNNVNWFTCTFVSTSQAL